MIERRKIVVFVGSKSDRPRIREGLNLFRKSDREGRTNVLGVEYCSAHRNPEELRKLVWKYAAEYHVDVIIICAGKLAAIFGEVDAILRNEIGNGTTRVIAVPLKSSDKGEEGEEASLAALLSAKQVPNSQFIFKKEFFDDPKTAFEYAIDGNIDPITLEKQKPPESFSLKDAYKDARNYKIPASVSSDELIAELELAGLFHEYTGKVRETFSYDKFPDLLYIYHTNRISIFDIVLPAEVLFKGDVLAATTVDIFVNDMADFPHHLVAFGKGIDEYLPESLRGKPELRKVLLVVKKAIPLPVEVIPRGYLTGSALEEYQKNNGVVCGIQLPPGLVDGSKLPEPIFTASTKAPLGDHDINITYEQVCELIGYEKAAKIRDMAMAVYCKRLEKMRKRGIILADTKFEFGIDRDGNIIFIDEIFTPDSSRFWPKGEWIEAGKNGVTPPSMDKQPVRNAGKAAGIKTTNPNWIPSAELLSVTSNTYLDIAEISIGKSLKMFQNEDMQV